MYVYQVWLHSYSSGSTFFYHRDKSPDLTKEDFCAWGDELLDVVCLGLIGKLGFD